MIKTHTEDLDEQHPRPVVLHPRTSSLGELVYFQLVSSIARNIQYRLEPTNRYSIDPIETRCGRQRYRVTLAAEKFRPASAVSRVIPRSLWSSTNTAIKCMPSVAAQFGVQKDVVRGERR